MKTTFTLPTVVILLSSYMAIAQPDSFIKKTVVLSTPKMNAVSIQKIKYRELHNGQSLSMDVYYPPAHKQQTSHPAVIFVLGYPDSVMLRQFGSKLKDMGAYTSWGRLIASEGIIGITYETQQPNVDLNHLLSFLEMNAAELYIDIQRIGFFAGSGNVLTAVSALMQTKRKNIKCAALLYGVMQTPDRKFQSQLDSLGKRIGFYSEQLEPVEKLSSDLPLLIVRAGRERVKLLNETIDHYVSEALKINAPITLINYAEGQHAFDLFDNNDKTRYIIQEILSWLGKHLSQE
jgi:acetyl esterase/lipase